MNKPEGAGTRFQPLPLSISMNPDRLGWGLRSEAYSNQVIQASCQAVPALSNVILRSPDESG